MLEPGAITVEELGGKRFSFYPAIVNIEHNEWTLGGSSWSEIRVVNSKTGQEIWIPRRFLGDISSAEEPLVIIGLKKELEYKAGAVWPYERRILSMPGLKRHSPEGSEPSEPPPRHAGSGSVSGPEKKVGRLVGWAMGLGIALILAVVIVTQRPVAFHGIEQSALPLDAQDDYASIVRKLGPPIEDRWKAGAGELQYRLLRFKDRPYALILMGPERDSARYIGAMDPNWKPVHYVSLPGKGDTLSLLRKLPRF